MTPPTNSSASSVVVDVENGLKSTFFNQLLHRLTANTCSVKTSTLVASLFEHSPRSCDTRCCYTKHGRCNCWFLVKANRLRGDHTQMAPAALLRIRRERRFKPAMSKRFSVFLFCHGAKPP